MTRAEFERLLERYIAAALNAIDGVGSVEREEETRAAVLAAFDEAMRGNDGK